MDLKPTAPKIELNIDEIRINSGGHLPQTQVRRAVEQELARHLSKNSPPGQWNPDNSKVNIDEIHIKTNPGTGPEEIGQQVAQQVHSTAPIKNFAGVQGSAPRRGEPISTDSER